MTPIACHRHLVSSIFAMVLGACASSDRSQPHSAEPLSTSSQPARTTLDPRIQHIVLSELDRLVREWQPEAATIVVLDPSTGAVLAMAGRDGDRPDETLASNRAFITGSTLKTFTIGAALEERTIAPDARVDCRPRLYGTSTLFDVGDHGMLTIAEVMTTSSNVGTSRVFDTLGLPRLDSWLRKFHFGESPGSIPNVSDPTGFEAAMLATGELAPASPLQVATAYSAIFNGGEYIAPSLTNRTSNRVRVLRRDTAQLLVGMLEASVSGEQATGRRAAIPGFRVAGKTGTADLGAPAGVERDYASFVGTVLDHEPQFVALVGLVAPRNDGSGPTAAAPAFSRLATRLIARPD